MLPNQVAHYQEFCGYRKEGDSTGTVDLRSCPFIYPTTTLPLITCQAKYGWTLSLDEASDTGGYLSYIMSRGQKNPYGRSYVAPVALPKDYRECESVLAAVYNLQSRGGWFDQNTAAFKYVVGELVDNIYQHSLFDYAYVMAQRYPARRFVELCFFDDGIGIPGSFQRVGKKYPKANHYRAIYDAMRGVSTKQEQGRGYGLSSNVEMFRDVGGEVLIVSGFGAVFLNKREVIPYQLDESTQMDGTLVSIRVRDGMRIPNIYEYAEGNSTLEEVNPPERKL